MAATLLTCVMLPDFWDRMIGSACLLISIAPSRFTLKMLSHALLSILTVSPSSPPIPTLL